MVAAESGGGRLRADRAGDAPALSARTGRAVRDRRAVRHVRRRCARHARATMACARTCADWRDLIATDVDAVLVLTSGSHAPIAIAAAEAGKHVLVEKPMCFSVAEGRAMIAAAERAGVTLMVAYNKRYDPAYRRLQDEAKGSARPAPGARHHAGIAAPALCRALPAARGGTPAGVAASAADNAGAHHRRDRRGRSAVAPRLSSGAARSAWCTSSTRSAACSASRTGWTSPTSANTG